MGEMKVVKGVVTAEDGGEAFLLDTRTRRYYRVNDTGLQVWRALERDAEPLTALAQRYPSVGEDVLARDVAGICERLLDAGLVQRPTAPG